MDSEDGNVLYRVVMNLEEQYSIWPVDRGIQAGWRTVGRHGTKADYLAYIQEAWTDMRPLSLRTCMAAPD